MRRAISTGIAFFAIAAAAPPSASASGLLILATHNEGGAANVIQTIVDLDSGHERTTLIHGETSEESGFDGRFWNFVNGAPNLIDLPSVVADQKAQMWVRRTGYRLLANPGETKRRIVLPNVSPINVEFDVQTRRMSKATIEGDFGPVVITFGDWRTLGDGLYPFRQHVKSDEGEQTDIVQSIRPLADVPASLIARPAPANVAHLAGEAVTVPFNATGRLKNHLLMAATVNGKPTSFIFDTGGANILTTDAAKRFAVEASGGMNIGGVGEGSEAGGFGLVDEVALGGASLSDQAFIVMPSFFPPEKDGKPSPVAGLVGYEFLAHFVTTIDYKAETITFRRSVPANQRGVRVPFYSDGHGIAVVAAVNGKPAVVSFDTGDGGTLTLFPTYTNAYRLDDGKTAATSAGGGVGGGVQATSGTLQHFRVGGMDFPNLPVRFSKNKGGAFASRYLAGNLGGSVLRCFRITFDFPHHEVWLEPQLDTPRCAASAPKA